MSPRRRSGAVGVRAEFGVEAGGEFAFGEKGVAPATGGVVLRGEEGEMWGACAGRAGRRDGAGGERLREFIAAQIRHARAEEAVHFHEVAEPVAPQSSAGGDDDGVALAGAQFVGARSTSCGLRSGRRAATRHRDPAAEAHPRRRALLAGAEPRVGNLHFHALHFSMRATVRFRL